MPHSTEGLPSLMTKAELKFTTMQAILQAEMPAELVAKLQAPAMLNELNPADPDYAETKRRLLFSHIDQHKKGSSEAPLEVFSPMRDVISSSEMGRQLGAKYKENEALWDTCLHKLSVGDPNPSNTALENSNLVALDYSGKTGPSMSYEAYQKSLKVKDPTMVEHPARMGEMVKLTDLVTVNHIASDSINSPRAQKLDTSAVMAGGASSSIDVGMHPSLVSTRARSEDAQNPDRVPNISTIPLNNLGVFQ